MSIGALVLNSNHLYKKSLVGNSPTCSGLIGSVNYTFPKAYAPYQKTTLWRKSNYSPGSAAFTNYPYEQHESHFSNYPHLEEDHAHDNEHDNESHHVAPYLSLEAPRIKLGILSQFNLKQVLYYQSVTLLRPFPARPIIYNTILRKDKCN